MADFISWWDTHKPSKRRIIQLYSALLYNAHLKGFAQGRIFTGKAKALCVPGLNCYSCPGAVGACPLGALQNALGSLNKNIGFYVIGIILLYGMLLGRTVCGWICPFGLIQELLYKIPTFKIKKSRFTRALSLLKYIILLIFAVMIPMYNGLLKGIQVPGFCKYICPAGTLEGAMTLLPGNMGWLSMLGPILTWKFVLMVIILTACILCYRSFCRFLCPLGAIYGMFNSLSVIGVRVDTGKCNNCGACVINCKMDVKTVGDRECIHCAKCVAGCSQSALSMKAGGFTLIPAAGEESFSSGEKKLSLRFEKILWGAAGLILVAALVMGVVSKNSSEAATIDNVNVVSSEDYGSDKPIGYEVGQRLENFEITCLDGSTFNLEDARGKVIFINLWATYCGPCVKELPYFDELLHKHEGDVEVIAVHANLTTEDVSAFLEDKNIDLNFAIDDEEETVFGVVNGSLALPQTIVLNRRGEVIYNQVGSVTEEVLETLYEKALTE